jgi:hypothetical protein
MGAHASCLHPRNVQMHDTSGHFGERRTVNLVMRTYWWHGIHKDASAVVPATSLA